MDKRFILFFPNGLFMVMSSLILLRCEVHAHPWQSSLSSSSTEKLRFRDTVPVKEGALDPVRSGLESKLCY